MKRGKAVIIGAGALGLGFLAERMAGDYDLCLADTSAKSDLLSYIQREQSFTLNVCGPKGIVAKKVIGSFETAVIDSAEGRSVLGRALREADLILTATGRTAVSKVVAEIAPALKARAPKAWLLFCENGLNIARTYAPCFGPSTVLVDTVMSRMCRFAPPKQAGYERMWTGGECLVVEDYNHLPLDADICASGPFSPAFALVSHANFLCCEDIKWYLHNGVHAFVACHACLEGVQFFRDTPVPIRERARELVLREVVPAIVATHPSADRAQVQQYGLDLLERFFNPYFNDSIERGVRGIEEKLLPEERLVSGCEYIKRAGIEPTLYATTTEAGRKIQGRQRFK
jgi:mannitol-1-phosphate/altronate dehydrogenase